MSAYHCRSFCSCCWCCCCCHGKCNAIRRLHWTSFNSSMVLQHMETFGRGSACIFSWFRIFPSLGVRMCCKRTLNNSMFRIKHDMMSAMTLTSKTTRILYFCVCFHFPRNYLSRIFCEYPTHYGIELWRAGVTQRLRGLISISNFKLTPNPLILLEYRLILEM